jgi:hypothetical protein
MNLKTSSEYAASTASPGRSKRHRAGRPINREPIEKLMTFGSHVPMYSVEMGG